MAWYSFLQEQSYHVRLACNIISASDSGCLGLFIRAVLDELQQSQTEATNIYEDNYACRLVANYSTPTRQVRHIAIRDFALQYWTEHNIIVLLSCSSNENASDMVTNQVGKILFACHNDNISGRSAFFRVNPLIRVPRPPSGARGGVHVTCGSPGFLSTPFT
jgi:hypothetical protein